MNGNLPIVAIMGRPNVGKSTLINRISATMTAIVDPTPGVTRDRKYVRARWKEREFMLADTGGVGIDADGWLSGEIERQAFFAAGEADVIIMVVDVTTGVTDDDEWLARKIKKLGRKSVLAVNKVDNPDRELDSAEFYALGMGDPVTISAYHGLGTGDLLDVVTGLLPDVRGEEPEPEIAVAIVGRPNVGKSSILNRIAGEERSLVHEVPHTTRDAVDTVVTAGSTSYRILDTAGIRRRRAGMSDVEYYSSVRTFRAIGDADVVLLVVDGEEGPTEHDQRIASKIESRGRAAAVLVNKWDLVVEAGTSADVMESVAYKFRFAPHLPLLRVSALTGRGMDRVLPLVDEAHAQWNRRIATPEINQFLASVGTGRAVPSKGGRRLKMYYATQAGTAPPTIVVFVNDAGIVTAEFRRYLVRLLREEYGFWGSPLRVHFKTARGRDR